MSTDLERIRQIALQKSARQQEEKKQKEDARVAEARRLANEHLPKWIKCIERAIPQIEQGYMCLEHQHRYWLGNYSNFGPRIDLIKLYDIPIDVYTAELNKLLGQPFRIHHGTDLTEHATLTVSWK